MGKDRETEEIRTMRNMAWARAQGELKSMLSTYYTRGNDDNRYERMKTAINDFVKLVKDEGLQE